MKLLSDVRQLLLRNPMVPALLVVGSVLLIAFLFIRFETHRLIGEEKLKASGVLSTLRARLEGEINGNISVLRSLKAEIAANPYMGQVTLERLAVELLRDNQQIKHIALAPDLVVKNIFPLQGNERALGLDYSVNEEQSDSVMKSVRENKIVISGPLTLVQGGEALVARTPVYLGGEADLKLWGIVSVVINYDTLLESSGIVSEQNDFSLSIRGRDGTGSAGAVFLGSGTLFEKDALLTTVNLPLGSWQMALLPKQGWSAPAGQLWLMWGGAFTVALILGLAAYLFVIVYQQKNEAMQTANYRANYDFLTGLPNRYFFTQRLYVLIKEMRREQLDFAVFFIDIDRFKQINDSLGHTAGDALLVDFANRLVKSSRDTDIVARLAGDEFVIVLRNVGDVIQADLLAEKLQKVIQQPFILDGRQHLMTASIGIAMYPVDGSDVTALLLHSDQAMYAAKRAGRNTHFFFNEGMREAAEHHLLINADIQRGLAAEEFELYYQPILNIRTQRIDKCEALIRWNHPEKGLIMPDRFISVAEKTGVIRELGNWILRQACKDLRAFLEADIDIKLSVNRSVSEFYSSKAYETWKGIFSENSVDSNRFIFEITESLFMDGHSSQINTISALRKLGVQFSIDDFGTGFSAINYLRNYPVDYLKIDKSFINDILNDEQDKTLVEVIIKMGRALGIAVVAEGVEQDEQLEVLESLECDYIQGYLLAKPMPLTQAIPFIHMHEAKQWGVESSPL